MPTHKAKALCLRSLQTDAPLTKAFQSEPVIAEMLSLYNLCKSMRSLPESGGLLDMRADHYSYFEAFASAEAEYMSRQ